MLKEMVVTTDGFNLIGREKKSMPHNYVFRGSQSVKSKKFDKFYYEAQYNNVPHKDISNYIQQRFLDTAEDPVLDVVDDVEFEELYDSFKNRLHKRLVRYRNKIFMNEWSYFVTFTYDDKKETAESFEKRLIIVFNNAAKRNGWKVIGGWENGELEGRSHFHAFIYVPDGQMIGELENRSRYSYKRHKMEYYVDNTYFSERFGMSDWIKVTHENLVLGGLVSYLVKYVVKSGRKLFYSRGIPSEAEMIVDVDYDVILSYNYHGIKHIIDVFKVKAAERIQNLQRLLLDSIDMDSAIEFDPSYFGYNNDEFTLVTVYT